MFIVETIRNGERHVICIVSGPETYSKHGICLNYAVIIILLYKVVMISLTAELIWFSFTVLYRSLYGFILVFLFINLGMVLGFFSAFQI